MNCMLDLARQYVSSGISVIPLQLDGSKAPASKLLPQVCDIRSRKQSGTWLPYVKRIAELSELEQWFCRPANSMEVGATAGIGMVCGAVSGGLEVIDFDMVEIFWPWVSQISRSTFNKLSIVETGGGGWHAIYRCTEICGNRKLASWEPPSSIGQKQNGHRDGTGFKSIGKGVRIETRGEGGYVVAEGSPCEVHTSGLPYAQTFGPRLPDIKYITPEERRELWVAAKQFDCVESGSMRVQKAIQQIKSHRYAAQRKGSTEVEPWDWYDQHGDPVALLTDHNWVSTDAQHWRRPGKDRGGLSATLRRNDKTTLIFTVFTTSDELGPRSGEKHRSFGPFALLTALKFSGNRKEAAAYVRKELMV